MIDMLFIYSNCYRRCLCRMLKAIQGILNAGMQLFGGKMFQHPTPPSRREAEVSAKCHPAAVLI
jgi:hypothetical protein